MLMQITSNLIYANFRADLANWPEPDPIISHPFPNPFVIELTP